MIVIIFEYSLNNFPSIRLDKKEEGGKETNSLRARANIAFLDKKRVSSSDLNFVAISWV